jgi:hypothetical protein
MMALQESCNLFQINNLDEIDKKALKKKYHRMCLKYHPDKNKHHNNEFSKMKECYETLNDHIDNNNNRGFVRKDNTENIYDILFSLISVENLEYIIKLVDSYNIYLNGAPEIITLNVTLKQVFDKCVFINNGHYIPLWHNVIHQFSVDDQKHVIYIIKINNICHNIRILKNNDIVANIPKSSVKKNEYNTINICEQVKINVYISTIDYKEAFVVYKNIGIPKTNISDIFDSSQISNIHLHLV